MSNLADFALSALFATRPDAEPVILWQLQQKLLQVAESLLGARDAGVKIFQPEFAANGPHIMVRNAGDGGWAVLSDVAGQHWPLTIHQLAHETTHLLSPGLAGTASIFEEGVAVGFSQYASTYFGLTPREPKQEQYREALELFRSLPGGFETARLARQLAGTLSAVTFDHLQVLVPNLDAAKAARLVTRFAMRDQVALATA